MSLAPSVMTHGVISEIRRRLVQARLETLSLIEGLGEPEAQWQPRSDAWSIKDHVAHLAAVEEAVIGFAWRMLTEQRPVADSYDVDARNARQREQRADLTWQEALAQLADVRGHLLDLLDQVPEEALTRTGSHPVWGEPITLASLLRVPYRHERGHRDEIEVLRNPP
jgi:uncharacterized damage-inducible protein DinB